MKSQQFTIPNIDTVFKFYKPKPPLSKFVETLWLYEGYEGYKAEEKTETILPTGTLELVINLRQNQLLFYDAERPQNCSRFSGAIVSGAHGHGFAGEPAAEAFLIGVHFSDSRRAISPTRMSIWKRFGERRRAGCESFFVTRERLQNDLSCSTPLC
ncbi:MAG TPA: DUF6597 domain-containing transcriptional factor [Pyrinomonadaceae bacterium]|nr:DUF6597 domain-containing transcriptional factor [Pyrinomonadaceae bacterium]